MSSQEYHGVYGEDVEVALRFLFNAMSAKATAEFSELARTWVEPNRLYLATCGACTRGFG